MSDSIEGRVPVVLIVDDQEWRARSLESVLGPQGFAVVKAYTGGQSSDLAQRTDPDLILTDYQLPDRTGCDVVRAVRSQGPAGSATPCVVMSSGPLSKEQRRECLEAGAWDILTPPLDPDEVVLKARTYIQAKRRGDRAQEQGLLDARTGYYNIKGLITRINEMAADAARWHRPLSCVVVGISEGGVPPAANHLSRVAHELRGLLRGSDALGHISKGELAVVAPGTDDAGAQRLAERLTAHLSSASPPDEDREALRVGIYSIPVEDIADLQDAPEEVLSRALRALRQAQQSNENGGGANRIRSFQP